MKCIEESSPGFFTFVQFPIQQTGDGISAKVTGMPQNEAQPYVVGELYDLAPLTVAVTRT